jgi:hypothetical protein
MAISFMEIAAVLGRYLLSPVVRRIMGDVEARRDRWELRSQEELVDYLQEEIKKEREKNTLTAGICEISEKAECQVCKSPVIVSEATKCPKCGIPYHPDCYDLMGSCSIFGCGGK